MKRKLRTVAILSAMALVGCGGGSSSNFGSKGSGGIGSAGNGGQTLGSNAGGGTNGSGSGGSGNVATLGDGGGMIQAVIRDFRFYDPNDSTTNPDFENPPYDLFPDGGAEPAGQIDYGKWDDPDIVADTIGSDGKPVYQNANGTTLTTHGKATFDQWYNDVQGTNYKVLYPLPLTQTSSGLSYSSSDSGIPYNVNGQSGNGFFPIDDGTPYATPFGNQVPTNAQPAYSGQSHNYSFTVEIDTVFTYQGGETFSFQGDDDVFVFIDGKRVINLGGIHGIEPASVSVDSLGLTVGKTYSLNFFSAERHVTGSNIIFSTTLQLQPSTGYMPPK